MKKGTEDWKLNEGEEKGGNNLVVVGVEEDQQYKFRVTVSNINGSSDSYTQTVDFYTHNKKHSQGSSPGPIPIDTEIVRDLIKDPEC